MRVRALVQVTQPKGHTHMSASIHGKEHIDQIVRVALEGASDSEATYPDDRLSWLIDPAGAYSHENVRQLAEHPERVRGYQPMTPAEFGDMLMRENVRSVLHRYPDTMDGGQTPGPTDNYWERPYTYPLQTTPIVPGMTAIVMAPPRGAHVRYLTSAEAFKAIHSLEYQSCEHDEWESSEAYRALCALKDSLERRLPGYSAADTW